MGTFLSRRVTGLAALAGIGAMLGVGTVAHADPNETPVNLTMVWRLQLSSTNYMDSLSRSEYNSYPTNAGLEYYLLTDNNTGSDPAIYRQRNNFSGQTTPSNYNPIAGDTLDGVIGYAFNTDDEASGGLTQLARLYDATTGDRFLALPGETKSGYTTESMTGFGFARNLANNTYLSNVTAGGISIDSNLNTGGALWNWTWNAKQFVNQRDYGREIQASYIAQNQQFLDSHGNPEVINPTEAGTSNSDQSIAIPLRQGSPLISLSNSGSVQSTSSVPLEWNPSLFGGDANHPLMWTDAVLGKTVTLNYQSRGAMVKYQTLEQCSYTSTTTAVEIPTAYLTGDFGRYYTYDAGKAAGSRLTEVHPPDATVTGTNVQFTPSSGYGGVILSTSDQTFAMGVYGTTVAIGGSVDYFTLWDYRKLGGTGPTDAGTSKWSAVYGPDAAFGRSGSSPTIVAGKQYTFTTWVTTGTLAQVESQMDWLKSQNLHGAITSQ